MRPTEELVTEHGAVELMLDILDKVINKLDSGEKVDLNDLGSIIKFIKVFVDKCHHGKEEDLLFPALERAGIPKEGGPVGVMLNDHQEGRGYVKEMAIAVVGIKKRDKEAAGVFAKNARSYIQLLRDHIVKEDNILYPLADAHLTAKQEEELKNGFAKVEEEIVGRGKHEEFHRLLDALKNKYLT